MARRVNARHPIEPAADPRKGRIVVVCNPRSHRIRARGLAVPDGVRVVDPRTRGDLHAILAELARSDVSLVVIAGGDGTIRDVLSCGGSLWASGGGPAVAILPKGKTNALAMDLGIPRDWETADAIRAWHDGRGAIRTPIEVVRDDASPGREPVRGFLFGAGAFVDATDMAQTTHRLGAFNNLAVALSTAGTVARVAFGGDNSPSRAGKRMRIHYGEGAEPMHGAALHSDAMRFIMLATTMHRMPMGVRPFGDPRGGLKTLVVDAPPRRFMRNFAAIVRGSTAERLERDGMHRVDARSMEIDLDGGFILDGERFDPGRYTLREGAPIRFVTP
nr:diacylglycerol kinase family protein [Croceicoccus hydrothermalis]